MYVPVPDAKADGEAQRELPEVGIEEDRIMSELKEHLFVPYSELQEGDELTDAFTIAKSYYLKSDADKVITDKDKEIVELQKQVHDYAQGLYVIQARAEGEM